MIPHAHVPRAVSPQISVAALVRVSTEGQAADGRAGLERQRATIRQTIAAKGLNCVGWHELVDVSGTNVSAHPTIKGILKLVLDGKIQGIVVADLDRLFRPDKPESYAILQVFQDMGAKIYSGDYEYDLTTKDGLLFSSIRSAISGFELGLMKERQHGAKEAKRRAGKCPTNALTLPHGVGYERKSETWHYTPEISDVIEMFRLFDEEGVRNYSELGRLFGIGQGGVKVILRNPIYTGWRVIDKRRGDTKRTTRTGKLVRDKVNRKPEDVIRVKVLEGVISEETHRRVLAELERTRFNRQEQLSENPSIHLGAGLAVCGHCGLPLFHLSGKLRGATPHRVGVYQCKSRYYLYRKRYDGGCKQCNLRADQLDAAIDGLAATVLSSPAHLTRILEASLARNREVIAPFAQTVAPSAQIEELKRRDARILKAYEGGAIDVAELRTKREDIRREIQALSKLQEAKPRHQGDSMAKLARVIVKAALRYPKITDVARKQQILRELFAEIHVRDRRIMSFRFTNALMQSAAETGLANSGAILLPNPIAIGPAPDVLPDGTKRCIKCKDVKPQADFYRRLNVCAACRKVDERRRHLRRQESKRARKA